MARAMPMEANGCKEVVRRMSALPAKTPESDSPKPAHLRLFQTRTRRLLVSLERGYGSHGRNGLVGPRGHVQLLPILATAVRLLKILFAAFLLGHPGNLWAQQAIPAELRVLEAPTPVKAEGFSHLIYELHVTNLGRTPLTIKRLEVLDEGNDIVQSYDEDSLLEILTHLGGQPDNNSPTNVIGPGLRVAIFIDIVRPESAGPLSLLRHRLTFEPVATPAAGVQATLTGGETCVSRRPYADLGPPLRGSGWVAMHGLSNASVHRRTILILDGRPVDAQRFAIDWTRIGPDGQVFRGNPANNANWTPYGAEVLAVADATVAAVRDDIPENDPTAASKAVPIDLETVGGNWIILKLADGRNVFYAHLQPGSLRVRPGDAVHKGQVIALLGNSGQADAPHLHIHVVDEPSPLSAEGLPLTFESYEIEGHLPSLKVLVDGTGWHPDGAAILVHGEMPTENAVVAFP